MNPHHIEVGEASEALPPPPPIPKDVVPLKAKSEKPKRLPMARPGLARKGLPIRLLTNHFNVRITNIRGDFFHYSVSLLYEDGREVDGRGIGRKVLDRLHETYASELGGKDFAYDGEKSLFTFGPLPANKLEFTVVLKDTIATRASGHGSPVGTEDSDEGGRKRLRRPSQSKTFIVQISFAAKIPLKAIQNVLNGRESEDSLEAFRVLDIILRQKAAKESCLLVRQSFFHDNPRNLSDLGGGVMACKGFHSSFRATQGGLSLNMDVSTTMTIKPGPVVNFLMENQNVKRKNPHEVDWERFDWAKAKRALKNLRIKASPSNMEFKITGLSEFPCNRQIFSLNKKNGDGLPETTEVTVYNYFVYIRNIKLDFSGDLPCINVGKPKRPIYFPVELCSLVSLQRYTKALSTFQRSALVERSRQFPQQRMRVLSEELARNKYDVDNMFCATGVSINTNFTQVDGRQLQAPTLRVGENMEIFPHNGRWNFNNKQLLSPVEIKDWAIVNFSDYHDVQRLYRDLIRCGKQKGIVIEEPHDVFEENPQYKRASPYVRVKQMYELLRDKLRSCPKFLLCILPEKKTSPLYGPWKKKNLSDVGVVTQCIVPSKVNDQYLTNVLLKINAKLGGLNSLLVAEESLLIPKVSTIPTIILGMDVSHGSPGHSDIPSIAAVVGSRKWPSISNYKACVRTQSPKAEMIDSLFKKVSDTEDVGIIRELLMEFFISTEKKKPQQIVIFRDGVSESQFSHVLNVELDQIIEACKFLEEQWSPKFTMIIAQKKHHTKFFLPNSSNNVPPGTVIDNKICHPRNNDFYICSHAGRIGTTRPTHYHVLYDEIGFSADELQELVHSLSYVYQRSTTAISIVAPVYYAHLAASQMSQFEKFEERSETSSGHGGVTSAAGIQVPELPRLHKNVRNSMFFC